MKTVATREAIRVINRRAVVLAAMDADHFARAHIPGSHPAPGDPQQLAHQVARLIAEREANAYGDGAWNRRHVPILVYGANERSHRPFAAAAALERAGHGALFVYQSGMAAWLAEGLATSNDFDRLIRTFAESAAVWEHDWDVEHDELLTHPA